MKSILHLKDDTEYQIPLRETETGKDNRVKVGANGANPKVVVKKAADVEKVNNREEATATQSQDDPAVDKETGETSQGEVNNKEEAAATQSQDDVDALETVEEDPEEPQNQEPSNTENNSNDTTTESVPQVDSAKAALAEMKKLASQKGVIHPSLFISNFSKILGLMERAMQLQVKESGSATEESGSVTKEEALKATEQAETTEKTETPAEGKQGELNGNNRS